METGFCKKCGEPQFSSDHRKENRWFLHEYEPEEGEPANMEEYRKTVDM